MSSLARLCPLARCRPTKACKSLQSAPIDARDSSLNIPTTRCGPLGDAVRQRAFAAPLAAARGMSPAACARPRLAEALPRVAGNVAGCGGSSSYRCPAYARDAPNRPGEQRVTRPPRSLTRSTGRRAASGLGDLQTLAVEARPAWELASAHSAQPASRELCKPSAPSTRAERLTSGGRFGAMQLHSSFVLHAQFVCTVCSLYHRCACSRCAPSVLILRS